MTAATLLATVFPAGAALVAYWSFDGGTVPERLEEKLGRPALDAVEVGANSWSTRAGFGEVLANGIQSSYLSVPDDSRIDFGSGDFSISLWTYRTSDAEEAKGMLDKLSDTAEGYQLFYQADNSIRIRLDDHLNNYVLVDAPGDFYTPNAWQHIAVTVDRTAGLVKIYVNGAESTGGGISIAALTGSLAGSQALHISTLNGTAAARGRLDDLALFDHVLTAGQLAEINAGGGVPVSGTSLMPVYAPAVSIAPAAAVFRGSLAVTLSAPDPAAVIRYTLDGTDPGEGSTAYAAPLILAATAEVRARSFLAGAEPGPVAHRTYYRVPDAPPNILLLAADALGYGDLACTGHPTLATPHLDALARDGRRFTQHYTPCAWSSAARYALLTGRGPAQAGFPAALPAEAAQGVHPREWLLPEALRKQGYATAMFGTWHLGGEGVEHLPPAHGFDTFGGLPWTHDLSPAPPLLDGTTVYDPAPDIPTLTSQLVTRAESWIGSRTEPFFLYMRFPMPRIPSGASAPFGGTSLRGPFGDAVEELDAAVGRLRAAVAAAGVAEHTLILFTSAHGPQADPGLAGGSPWAFRGGAGSAWEGGVRVPMLACWPGTVPAGSVCADPTWHQDLYTTCLALAGAVIPPDRPMDGADISPLMLGDAALEERLLVLYGNEAGAPNVLAARRGPWKLHVGVAGAPGDDLYGGARPLLFKVEEDFGEVSDLAANYPGVVSALQAEIAAYTLARPAAEGYYGDDAPPRNLLPGPVGMALNPDAEASLYFQRPFDTWNEHYAVETSTNLITWLRVYPEGTNGLSASPTFNDLGNGLEEATLHLSPPLDAWPGPAGFFRVRAEGP